MKLLISKKGDQTVVQFLIGLILVCIVIYTFSRLISSCLKPEDRSSKTFQALADKIALDTENLTGVQKDVAPTFTNIAKDEVLLFFDKGENYSVYFPAKSDLSLKENFFTYHEQPVAYLYDMLSQDSKDWLANRNIIVTVSTDMIYAFKKPTGCDDSACMVLCKEKDLRTTVYSSYQIRFSDYEVTLPKPVVVSCSNPKQLRTFDNIGKFYRKPFFTYGTYFDGDKKKDYFFGRGLFNTDELGKYYNSVLSPGAFFSSKFFCIAESSESGDKSPQESIDAIGRWIGKLSFNCVPSGDVTRDSSQDIISVSEHKDSEWQNITLIQGQYIFTQAFNNNVALCYSPPCLSLADEMYINWGSHLDGCFQDVTKCPLLNDDIVRYAGKKTVAFKLQKDSLGDVQLLHIQQGDNDFAYNMDGFNFVGDLRLQVEYVKENKEKEIINADELSLSYDDYAGGNNLRLDVGDREFSFIGAAGIRGAIAADIGPVPTSTLKFIVQEYTGSATV
jgi:hypothetical protein